MNLGIVVLWLCIGAAAGWFGSKIMGTYARREPARPTSASGSSARSWPGSSPNSWLGAGLGYPGDIIGLGGALVGSCVGIFCWQALSRRKA